MTAGVIASLLMIFPTGDSQAKNVAFHQPPTLAAMEGLFRTVKGAPIVLIGQPNPDTMQLDNPLIVPNALSLLTYRRWKAEVKDSTSFRVTSGRITFRCSITAITSWWAWERFFW